MLKKGLFITFEGGEGAGKTTLMKKLAEKLKKHEILQTREPGGTQLGESVRSILLNPQKKISARSELTLFLACRSQHIEEVILPALEEGKIVLCDRFNDSSVAYQGAARSLGMEKVQKFCNFICNNLQPDRTFYLDIDPAIGLKRASGSDRIESEKLSFHETIRSAFLILAKQHPERIHVIDARKTADQVFAEVLNEFSRFLVKNAF